VEKGLLLDGIGISCTDLVVVERIEGSTGVLSDSAPAELSVGDKATMVT